MPYSPEFLRARRQAQSRHNRLLDFAIGVVLLSVVVVVGLFVATEKATAGEISQSATDWKSNGLVQEILPMARSFWEDRGVHPCANPSVGLADTIVVVNEGQAPINADGASYLGGDPCVMLLSRAIIGYAQAHPSDEMGSRAACELITHEEGWEAPSPAAATQTGVQSQEPLGTDANTPYFCKVWATARAMQTAPKVRAARKRGRRSSKFDTRG